MSEDLVTVTEAARLLDTTKEKIARLVKQGVLTSRPSVLDARKRLIPREEIERVLEAEGRGALNGDLSDPIPRPRPRTAGIYSGPIEIQSDEVEDYLRHHWRSE